MERRFAGRRLGVLLIVAVALLHFTNDTEGSDVCAAANNFQSRGLCRVDQLANWASATSYASPGQCINADIRSFLANTVDKATWCKYGNPSLTVLPETPALRLPPIERVPASLVCEDIERPESASASSDSLFQRCRRYVQIEPLSAGEENVLASLDPKGVLSFSHFESAAVVHKYKDSVEQITALPTSLAFESTGLDLTEIFSWIQFLGIVTTTGVVRVVEFREVTSGTGRTSPFFATKLESKPEGATGGDVHIEPLRSNPALKSEPPSLLIAVRKKGYIALSLLTMCGEAGPGKWNCGALGENELAVLTVALPPIKGAPTDVRFVLSSQGMYDGITEDNTNFIECFPASSSVLHLFAVTSNGVYHIGEIAKLANNANTAISFTSLSPVFAPESGQRSIGDAAVFGDCFRHGTSPSQRLWLAVATAKTADGTASFLSVSPIMCKDGSCVIIGKREASSNESVANPDGLISLPLKGKGLKVKTAFQRSQDITSVPSSLSHGFIHAIAVATDEFVTVALAQEKLCEHRLKDEEALLLEEGSSFGIDGSAQHLSMSENGFYVFITLNRQKWEMASMTRLNEVCNELMKENIASELVTNPSGLVKSMFGASAATKGSAREPDRLANVSVAVFLKDFAPICFELKRAEALVGNIMSINFASMLSACPAGVYCPFLNSNPKGRLINGDYSLRSNEKHRCPKGFFCPEGLRLICPLGSICPFEGMTRPLDCDRVATRNVTCYRQGLEAPLPCPAGYVCRAPDRPPIPAAPGMVTFPSDRRVLLRCAEGDYCPLAAEATEPAPPPSLKPSRSLAPRCPAGFYCPSASILSPRQCSFHVSTLNDLFNASLNPQELCLEGSSYPSLCTAGFYCPNSTAAIRCAEGEGLYCPAGAQNPMWCPEGFYCPSPSSLQRCPAGYFCLRGSMEPKKCSWLLHCPEGSVHGDGYLGLGFSVIAFIVCLVALDYSVAQ